MPRPSFVLTLTTTSPPEQAWASLWNLDEHTRAVPLTRVERDDQCGRHVTGRGDRFTASTRLGPWTLADRMVVLAWHPPRRAVIEKVGSALHGRIVATVEAAPGGSTVTWHQTYAVAGLPDAVARVSLPLVRWGYARVLRRILRGQATAA